MISASKITRPDEVRTLSDDDVALVHAAKEGSVIAFEELVKRHESRMFRIAQNLLHNREDAQDVVQDAFLKAFQKLWQFQARSKFSTWLTRITLNVALTKLPENTPSIKVQLRKPSLMTLLLCRRILPIGPRIRKCFIPLRSSIAFW